MDKTTRLSEVRAAAIIRAITAHRRIRAANRRRLERVEILPARAISQAQGTIPELVLRGPDFSRPLSKKSTVLRRSFLLFPK